MKICGTAVDTCGCKDTNVTDTGINTNYLKLQNPQMTSVSFA